MLFIYVPSIVFLLQSCVLHNTIAVQDCTLPSNSDVELLLRNEVTAGGGDPGSTTTINGDPYYVCQVQGTTMGTYRELSVIMEYIDSANMKRVGQFEMTCQISPDDWSGRSDSLENIQGTLINGSIDLWTNCSSCINTADNRQHCQGCDPSCSDGLMKCTGSNSGDCCVAFEEDGVCKTDTECSSTNFVANIENNFTCSCNMSSSSCDPGYTFTTNSSGCFCVLSNICLTQPSPCNNNGSCTLDSLPENFTCNCTGTGFTGDTCQVETVITTTTAITTRSSSTVTMVSMATSDVSYSKGSIPSTTGPIQTTSTYTQVNTITTTSSSSARLVSSDVPGPSPSVEQKSIDKSSLLAVIIVSVLFGLLLLLVLIVLIIYIIYGIVPFGYGRTAVTYVKWDNNDPMNGSAYSNPIYINPDEIT